MMAEATCRAALTSRNDSTLGVDMAHQHAHPGGAGHFGGGDELLVADHLHPAADHAGRRRPAQEADHQDLVGEPAADQRHHDDGDQQLGQDLEGLGDAHQRLVERAAEEAGNHADGHAEDDAQHGAEQADH